MPDLIPLDVITDEHPPLNAAVDLRPTRQYQLLLLLSGFFMTFHVIGINTSYAIFQEFYTSPQSTISDAKQQDALVSLVGTLATGLTWSGSIFVNPLLARTRSPRIITLLGVLIMSLGLILASLSTRLWHLFLTQAILYGLGASLYYFPIMSLTPAYFDRNRGFALGVVLAGSGVGGVVIAPALRILIDKYGVAWALRVLGLWNALVGVPVACVVKQRPGFGGTGRNRIDLSLVKRGTFVYQSLGAFLQASGNVVPVIYLTTYSTSVLSYPTSTGSLLLAINSAVNSASRIAMGILADQVGRQNTMITSVILSGLSVLALWYNAARPRFLAFVVLYGVYAGGYNALLPTTITEIYGVQHYASVNGFVYFIRGIGAIVGAPLAGVILGSHKRGGISLGMSPDGDMSSAGLGDLRKRYNEVVVYDAVLLLAAGACVAYVRWLEAKEKGRWVWKA